MLGIFQRKKKQLAVLDDPALPADVRAFAEKHVDDTNIIELFNGIYKRFDRNPIARAKRYRSIMEFFQKSFQESLHEARREERRKHLIKLLKKAKKKAAN